jgi:hypothetical protein
MCRGSGKVASRTSTSVTAGKVELTPPRGACWGLYIVYSIQTAKVYYKLNLYDNQSRKSSLREPPEFKEATVAFSPTYYELDYDSKYDLIDYIGILPHDDIYPPLARSLLPYLQRYLYPDKPRSHEGGLRARIYAF